MTTDRFITMTSIRDRSARRVAAAYSARQATRPGLVGPRRPDHRIGLAAIDAVNAELASAKWLSVAGRAR